MAFVQHLQNALLLALREQGWLNEAQYRAAAHRLWASQCERDRESDT